MAGILVVFLLAGLILVHELGHFLAARWFGVEVEEFGIGLPPRLWAKKRGKVIYSLNILPVGGFVRLRGEEEALTGKPFLVQAGTLIAGPLANFFLAVVIFAALAWVVGVPQKLGKVKVLEVAPNSPAHQAGVEVGDFIVAIGRGREKVEVSTTKELVEQTKKWAGSEVVLWVEKKGGERVVYRLVPRVKPPVGEGAMGVVISDTQLVMPPFWQRPFLGIKTGIKEAFWWGRKVASGLSQVAGKLLVGRIPKEVVGPVGIYKAGVAVYRRDGGLAVLHFFGVLSVNLTVFNFLPLPALDGGQLALVVVEKICRRQLATKTKRLINQIGFIFLLLLLFLIVVEDLK